MVIASIDIQNGKVVQLRQGKELVLEKDDAEGLAREFDRYGEVAVIDLDAAMGTGSNSSMIRKLLRLAECRVGGGIRNAEQAKELVSLGAGRIIAGSACFRDPGKKGAGREGGEFAVNTAFLASLAGAIGRQRVIVAVDAAARAEADGAPGGYEIVVDGWKTRTGLDLAGAAKAVEPYASELLFTCVDREGTMTGIDLEPVKLLRGAVSCRITAAGGVSSPEELEALAALGCDVQLGMALYTGKINLADAFVRSLNWKKGASFPGASQDALLPLIVESPEGQVVMTGFADREALRETFARGMVCFHSRSRGKLWMKGETSGNTLALKRLRADCDRDAILAVAEPSGPVCHTGDFSCFALERRYTWETLQSIIAERLRNPAPGSYTAALDDELVREKIREEAEELCTAQGHDEVVWEAADLLYFATVLMTREGVKAGEVLDELDRRHKK
ncbi:MAG: phosphoribosyl-ATP diphosphatase [Treponema sp.]|jgi:phosphoribosyl-ATP pyrophosphohydrolase/phosphoribosyl-AMP cyclohydrolase|nr:phosphoribosyl-ATP diphosphatase [Treponema sp.]